MVLVLISIFSKVEGPSPHDVPLPSSHIPIHRVSFSSQSELNGYCCLNFIFTPFPPRRAQLSPYIDQERTVRVLGRLSLFISQYPCRWFFFPPSNRQFPSPFLYRSPRDASWRNNWPLSQVVTGVLCSSVIRSGFFQEMAPSLRNRETETPPYEHYLIHAQPNNRTSPQVLNDPT